MSGCRWNTNTNTHTHIQYIHQGRKTGPEKRRGSKKENLPLPIPERKESPMERPPMAHNSTLGRAKHYTAPTSWRQRCALSMLFSSWCTFFPSTPAPIRPHVPPLWVTLTPAASLSPLSNSHHLLLMLYTPNTVWNTLFIPLHTPHPRRTHKNKYMEKQSKVDVRKPQQSPPNKKKNGGRSIAIDQQHGSCAGYFMAETDLVTPNWHGLDSIQRETHK